MHDSGKPGQDQGTRGQLLLPSCCSRSWFYCLYVMLFIAVDNPGQREHVHDGTARDRSAFNRSANSLRAVQRSSETHLYESGALRLRVDR